MVEREDMADMRRAARDWLVRIQLGDTLVRGDAGPCREQNLAAFERWRAADPAHAAAYDEMLASLQKADPLSGGRMVAESRLRRAGFIERRPVISAAIATGLLAIIGAGAIAGFGWDGQRLHLSNVSFQSEQQADAVEVTRVGQARQIALPDGSSVLLDTDSELRIRYSAHERLLRLDRGRARFTVAHDATRPFVVVVGDTNVTAHGTIFDVSVGAQGVHVALLRGAVEVRHKKASGAVNLEQSTRQLAAGQAIDVAAAAPLPQPQPIPSGEPDWVSGHLNFRDMPLVQAIAAINRYNLAKIVLAPGVDGTSAVTGGFDARAPRAFAVTIARVLGLQFAPLPDGRLLLSAGTAPGSQ